jgi:hypothetical protein
MKATKGRSSGSGSEQRIARGHMQQRQWSEAAKRTQTESNDKKMRDQVSRSWGQSQRPSVDSHSAELRHDMEARCLRIWDVIAEC